MSHYTTLATKITSAQFLARALTDVGCRDVETHAKPVAMKGWGAGFGGEAEVVVRAGNAGGNKYDLGFAREKDGFFVARIVNEDRSRFGSSWLAGVHQRYAFHVTCDTLAQQGFEVAAQETGTDQTIRLTLRRMS